MEARHDLRKFITESAVAQRCAVLSSGREVAFGNTTATEPEEHREIVGRLTPWAGIESSTAMGSDQKAAEALQWQRPNSVSPVMVDRGAYAGPRRLAAEAYRSAYPSSDVGLTA